MIELMDLPITDKFNAIGGGLIVIASYIFGAHWELFVMFLALNATDYVTGVMKSKMHHTESSSSGLKGIVKKFGYWVMIVLAFVMGDVMSTIGDNMGLDLSLITPVIGWYTLASLALNEVRSILENLVECDVDVPPFLIRGLKVLTDKVNKGQEALFDGMINLETHSQEDNMYSVEIQTPEDELKEKGTVTLKITTTENK